MTSCRCPLMNGVTLAILYTIIVHRWRFEIKICLEITYTEVKCQEGKTPYWKGVLGGGVVLEFFEYSSTESGRLFDTPYHLALAALSLSILRQQAV